MFSVPAYSICCIYYENKLLHFEALFLLLRVRVFGAIASIRNLCSISMFFRLLWSKKQIEVTDLNHSSKELVLVEQVSTTAN